MKSRTAVCAYGKNGEVERIFERLFTMYLSNYSDAYSYGAVIDLPDSVCYRAADDAEREEMAKKCVDHLNKSCGGSFFCVMRQRRYTSLHDGYVYTCEGGALGALKSLWRYIGGRTNEAFPVYGCVPKQVERVYFASYDEERPSFESRRSSFECIEPNGIFRLGEQLTEGAAAFPCKSELCFDGALVKSRCSGAFDLEHENSVFPFTGAIVEAGSGQKVKRKGLLSMLIRSGKRAEGCLSCEGLYSVKALDNLLFVGAGRESIRRENVSEVRLAVYPTLFRYGISEGKPYSRSTSEQALR